LQSAVTPVEARYFCSKRLIRSERFFLKRGIENKVNCWLLFKCQHHCF